MKKILIGIGALALLLIIAFFVPSKFRVERSIVIQSEATKIYPLVNNFKRWQEWTAWNKETYPNMEFTYDGPAEGVGSVSIWKDKSGDGKMTMTASDATGIQYDLEFQNGSMKSKGGISFSEVEGGTRVTWRSFGEASLLFKPLLDGMIGPDLEKGLNKLKTVIESASSESTVADSTAS